MTISRAPAVFPRSEYLRRLAAVKEVMVEREIDVLCLANGTNIAYLTGHTSQSDYVPQALVITTDQEEPTFITRPMDTAAALHTTFLARDKVLSYPEDRIANPDQDGFDFIIDFLNEVGVANRSLGLELGQLSSKTGQKFQARLSQSKIVDFTNVVGWIRGVKSDLEIALMREAAAISDAAIMRAADVIRPGVREADAIAEIAGTLARGVNGKPGTAFSSIFLCASPRISTAHIAWTEDSFHQGSQVNLELTGVRHNYVAPIMRTYSIGKPSDRLRRINDGEIAGLNAALAMAKAGNTCHDVAHAFNSTLKKYGFEKKSRAGYAVGINWTEPTASLRNGDMTILKPNMTFHMMLGNWVDEEFGYVISETFRVTHKGGDSLTQAPRQLFEV